METLSNTNHETTKIPDFILLRKSREDNVILEKRNAMLQTQIEILLQEVERLNAPKKDTIEEKAERMKMKSELLYQQQKDQIHKLNKVIRELRKTNEGLICKLAQLQK